VALVLAGTFAAGANAAVYQNTTPITIPATQGNASPYGTSIDVSGVPGLVSRVGVELVGVQHGFAADLRVLLVGPAGTAWILNRQGGFGNIDLGNLRIDTDTAARTFSDLPDAGLRAIEPERDPGTIPMPAPAPLQSTYGASLRPLLGGSPNGTWTLYIRDESSSADGSVAGGWRLHLDTTTGERLNGLELDGGSPAAVESGAAVIHLLRETDRAPLGAVDVRVRSVDGTAVAGEDFEAVDEVVHFPSGSDRAELRVELLDDDPVEAPETFSIEYVDLPGGANGVAPPTDPLPPVTIVDEDGPPGLFAKFPSTPVDMREGGQLPDRLPAVRTGSTADPLQITWEVLGGSASAGDVNTGAPVELPANNRFPDLDVPGAVDDIFDESPIETTTFFLKAAGTLVTTAPVRVFDNEGQALLALLPTSEAATESDGTKGAVFATREGGALGNENATVTITQGTAKQGVDYDPGGSTTRPMSFGSMVTGQRVQLNPGTKSDVNNEGNEEIRATLSSATPGAVDPARAGVNVLVFDSSPPPGYGGEIAPDPDTDPTAEGAIIRILVRRIGPTNTAVSAHFESYDVTAVAGRDYQPTSGTISWGAFDSTPKEIQVFTTQDNLVEGEERVGVKLDTPTISDPTRTIGLSPAAVEGRIDDDDFTGPGQLDVDADALTVAEGQPVEIPVHRTLGQAGAVEATCRVADDVGSASPGDDVEPSGKATFADGIREGTCTLDTTADAFDEPDETFRVELVDPTGGAVIGPQSTRDVTIADDDDEGGGTASIKNGPRVLRVLEGAGSARLVATRRSGLAPGAGFSWSFVPGTARRKDVAARSGTATFEAGQSARPFEVPIADDGLLERNERFRVLITDPIGGLTLTAPTRRTVKIVDDDGFARVKVRTRRARLSPRGRVRVRLACPRKARRACAGRLSIRKKGKKRVVLGTARYSIEPRRKRAVRVRIKESRRALIAPGETTELRVIARARPKVVRDVKRRILISRL